MLKSISQEILNTVIPIIAKMNNGDNSPHDILDFKGKHFFFFHQTILTYRELLGSSFRFLFGTRFLEFSGEQYR